MTENFEAEVCGAASGIWPWQWNHPSLNGLFSNTSSSPCCNSSGDFGFINPEFFLGNNNNHNKAWSSGDEESNDNSPSLITDWNHALIQGGGSSEGMNYTCMLQQEDDEASGMNRTYESVNHESPVSYGYSSASCDLLPHQINIFENEPHQTKQQVPLYDTSNLMNGFQATLLNEFSRNSLNEVSCNSSSNSSSIEKQKPSNLLQLPPDHKTAEFCINNALNDHFPVNLSHPAGPQFLHPSLNHGKRPNSLPTFKPMIQNDEIEGMGTVTNKKSNCVPTFKRPRIETPTPLPTFKVRKEKMGDRITALQQLVSPFGKTDTASVLHEAIEYIKFLHDQVNVLSTPYLKNGVPVPRIQKCEDKRKKKEGKQDLKSRGLCLVPISSTFPVAAENTTDFWIPTFGGTFR